ncbi:MAG: hypothetical protein IJ943_01525 [Akkermansia sp.]|nr:hypothetical protein [Akkermansia sp.]
MKKIFGLFAMAALATTGLTCCGGGGGGDSHAYRTYTFDGPELKGVMQVRVLDQMDGVNGKYNATISFSEPNTKTYSGYFKATQVADEIKSTNKYETQPEFDEENNLVTEGTFKVLQTTEKIEVGIYSSSEGNDNAMVNFFQDFVDNVNEDEDADGDVNVESPPKPTLSLKYDPNSNGRSGDYMMTIETEVKVTQTQKDENGQEKEVEVKRLKPANLGPYSFTVTY